MKKLFYRTVYYLESRKSGASAVEYILIVSLIALAIIVGLTALSGGINTAFTNIVNIVTTALGL